MADMSNRIANTLSLMMDEGDDPSQRVIVATSLLDRMGIRMPETLGVELDPETFAPRTQMGSIGGVVGETDDFEQLGRFAITGELGAGGMGRVLEGRDPELRRTVAIKILSDPREVTDSQLSRFVAEAQLTAQLEHPHIVPVHDLGATADGQVYFVMKKVEGQSLWEILAKLDNKDPATIAEFTRHKLLTAFVQVCYAIGYAHSRGVLHRDLKPANLMLGRFGEVLVMDWGLARLAGDTTERFEGQVVSALGETGETIERVALKATMDGQIIGTPGYMSPEQGRGELDQLDARSDVFSLGVILYEILTQKPAFPGDDPYQIIRDSRTTPPMDPQERSPELVVPEEIAKVCMRALSIDRDGRYGDAVELADAVSRFLEGAARRDAALALVAEAIELIGAAKDKKLRAATLRAEAADKLQGVPSFAPEEEKAEGWRLEDEAGRFEDEASMDEVRFGQAARAALERVPDLAEAYDVLAEYYKDKHGEAEAAGDARAAARFSLLLDTYDRGRYAEYLEGVGRLTLVTDPPGAEVDLYRFVPYRRRIVTEHRGVLGTTPLHAEELPMGSYVAVLRAPGRAEVRYPFVLERGGSWGVSRPGATQPTPIHLPEAGALDEQDVFVPGGWADLGGDAGAAGSLPGRRIWVDDFVMRRFPVTQGEYIEFLNDLVARGETAAALEHAPRQTAAREGELGDLLLSRDSEGRFAGPADGSSGWLPEHPVAHIEWSGAVAYADWVAERTGLPWRLACELEWEKACRGTDKRFYAFGNLHDHSWAVTVESHPDGTPRPHPVDSYPTDESPYGIRGLVGGVRDWCIDAFVPAGPKVTEEGLLVVPEAGDPALPHMTRGGAWSLPDWVGRAAVRGFHPPIRLGDLGMRLVRHVDRK